MLHAVGVAVTHGVQQGLAFALPFFNVVTGAQSGFQDFDGGYASFAVFPGEQALRNNEAKCLAEAGAHGMLVGDRKNADDAFDSLGGINSVQRKAARRARAKVGVSLCSSR